MSSPVCLIPAYFSPLLTSTGPSRMLSKHHLPGNLPDHLHYSSSSVAVNPYSFFCIFLLICFLSKHMASYTFYLFMYHQMNTHKHLYLRTEHRVSLVQFSCSVISDSVTPWLQHSRPPCPSPIHGVYPNSCPSSQWCLPTLSSSVVPFSCLQSFPASGSFQMSQFFMSGGQNIRASASESVLHMNIQDWFLLGWTGLISLLSKGLSRVFLNTTVQKHQFFVAQLSL